MRDTTLPEDKPIILIVDDNRIMRETARNILDSAGFRAEMTGDGASALAFFRKRRPDLILLDLIMPGKNGFDVCRELRCEPGSDLVPILVLTGLDDEESARLAFDAGATDFIAKPVKAELLVHRVRYLLRGSQSLNKLAESTAQLTLSQQIASLGSWELHPSTGIFRGSPQLSRVLGMAEGSHISSYEAFLSLLPDREIVASALATACETRSSCSLEFQLLAGNGKVKVLRMEGQAEMTSTGDLHRLVGVLQDITAMRQVEDRLVMLKKAVDSLPIGITLIGTDGNIIYSNPAEAEMHGYRVEELLDRKARELAPESSSRPLSLDELNKVGMWRRETVNVRKTGEQFPVQLISLAVKDANGRCLGLVTTCEDITSRKEAEERINHLAYYDVLTGLPNRGMFMERLHHALAVANRERLQICLMFIDLDDFKDINDTRGHDFGDKVLQEVARRLAANMRESDTLARLGGDEFVLILNSVDRQEGAAVAARRILSVFSVPLLVQNQPVHCRASVGIALFPHDGHDAESLIKCADTAMYFAKEKGKAQFRFFSPDLNERLMHRVAMESSLRDGLEKKEFLLYYQPKWDVSSARIIGVEALVRWQSSDFGLMLPAQFIALAEATGLIVSLGEWVLRTASLQCRQWELAGYSDLKVAVNISPLQFRQPDFAEMVARIIVETGITPGNLELEFTESTIMEKAEETVEILKKLKGMGVQLSIDDFGTGFSSLSYLKHFAIDRIKIDRTFVTDIGQSSDDAAIVEGIIEMGHHLNLKVLAEGVEEPRQLHLLKELGCDEVQGFYLGLPMSAEDLTASLLLQQDGSMSCCLPAGVWN